MICNMLRYPLGGESQVSAPCTTYHEKKKKSTALGRFLDFEETCHIYVCYFDTLTKSPLDCQFWVGTIEKALQQIKASVQVFLPLGPYNLVDPMILKCFIVRRDAVLESQASPQEGNHRTDPLGF